MLDLQREVLTWAAGQSAGSGLTLLGGGLVYGFFGARLNRFLTVISSAACGAIVGVVAAAIAGLGVFGGGLAAALLAGSAASKWERVGLAISSAGIWALLGFYLGGQLRFPPEVSWAAGALTGLLGLFFALICPRSMRVIVTALHGALLMTIGFVTVSSNVLPELGETLRGWAGRQALLLPVFIMMLFVTAYSYQAMRQQGDIKTAH